MRPVRHATFAVAAAFTLAMSAAFTLAMPGAANAAPSAWGDDCPSSYFCVWDGYSGAGHICKWQDDSYNWYEECSWADSAHPKSVYNHGTSGLGVRLYRYPAMQSEIGDCVTKGKKVNLAGNYFIGSHEWNCY
ncbi:MULTISPECIES: peptidase inhibitor family I36 protein [Streptomyces]|uniref:peptidase inhibitor family I36 protein n=1 Tax=Streptomyces lycopersici TaxID=2974589 RepID=UPI0021D08F2E|nr:peptidase inhibitor family I36 protein [Streptomyces sp. NEAU-383]